MFLKVKLHGGNCSWNVSETLCLHMIVLQNCFIHPLLEVWCTSNTIRRYHTLRSKQNKINFCKCALVFSPLSTSQVNNNNKQSNVSVYQGHKHWQFLTQYCCSLVNNYSGFSFYSIDLVHRWHTLHQLQNSSQYQLRELDFFCPNFGKSNTPRLVSIWFVPWEAGIKCRTECTIKIP